MLLGSVYVKQGLPLHIRVMTALKFVTNLKKTFDEQGEYINKLCEDAFLINTENGDVEIDPEKLIEVGNDNSSVSEQEISGFVAYVVFRLLCIDSPYDGRQTLTEFPFLTNETKKDIESGKYGFIFSEGDNRFSEYKGKDTYHRWVNIPGKVREVLAGELSGECVSNHCLMLDDWLKAVRILRDYLVFTDGQFKFCNPEKEEKALFINVDDYRIPVWPRKAVYAYHVDADIADTENGLVAGINAEGRLENRSALKWIVSYENENSEVNKGDSIKLEPGMTITINEKEIKIGSGDSNE